MKAQLKGGIRACKIDGLNVFNYSYVRSSGRIQAEFKPDKPTDRETDMHTDVQPNSQTGTPTDREEDSETQTERPPDRQTDRREKEGEKGKEIACRLPSYLLAMMQIVGLSVQQYIIQLQRNSTHNVAPTLERANGMFLLLLLTALVCTGKLNFPNLYTSNV